MSSTSGTSAAAASGKSTQTFITALVLNLIVAGVELVAFIILKNRFRKIYAPRSYLVPPRNRVDPLPHSFIGWIPAILRANPKQIIAKNGMDAYVFVRFLFLMVEIFLPFTVVTWIVLLPVDAARSGGGKTGVDQFTFGNVGTAMQPRYAAHLIIVWLLTFYVFYLLRRELSTFVQLRQDFLISKEHAQTPKSKTVLVTGVAKEYLNAEALTDFCSVLPGGVSRVWIARDLKELPDLYDRRTKACGKLESAETKILKAAAKAIKSKKGPSAPSSADLESESSVMSTYVAKKKRPTHKLGLLGLIGKKVDTIDWAREEIGTTNTELARGRKLLNSAGSYPPISAAFIQFNDQLAAHMFAQCLNHHGMLRMSARYLEVSQEDVIWSNLSINPYQARLRYVASWAMTLGLIILWSFPVAFVGLLSNVNSLCTTVKWMAWLCKLPTPVSGIIQGALPPIALAVLFILLPIILRLFARFEGIPLHSAIELSLMTRFFIFLVIHGFLIVTLSSGLVAAIPQISQNPGSAVTLLAQKLPAASTFFLTYFVTQGLGGAAGSLLQIATLIVFYVKLFLLGSTPRSVYNIKFKMSSPTWGTLFPNMTLLTVIGITYSVIAPLVAGFAFLSFILFWFVYKYLFLWVYDVPVESETGGRFYPKALTHIFVGLYIEQICLAGLFFLAEDTSGSQSAIPEGAFMVILILITIFFQLTLNSGYGPLIDFIPLSFGGKVHQVAAEVEAEHEQHRAGVKAGNGEKADYSTANSNGITNGEEYQNGAMSHEEDSHVHAFDHPATYENQDMIWIPADEAGLYKREIADTEAAGAEASSEGASMNAKGTVEVVRSPPGTDWDESQKL